MKDEQKEETLLIINPAMFRGEPVGFIICVDTQCFTLHLTDFMV